jgi:hypothetical protein
MSLLSLLIGIMSFIPKYGTYKHFITIPFIGNEYIEAEIVNHKILLKLSGLVNIDGYANYYIINNEINIEFSKNIKDFLNSKLTKFKLLNYDKQNDEVFIQLIIGKLYKINVTLHNTDNTHKKKLQKFINKLYAIN